MKPIYYTTIKEKIIRDRPEGEMLCQDYLKVFYIFGIKVRGQKIDYECNLLNKENKPGYK